MLYLALVRCGKLGIEFTIFLRGDADNVWLIPIACAKGLRRLRDLAFVVVAPDFDFNLGAGCNRQGLGTENHFLHGKAILGDANQTRGIGAFGVTTMVLMVVTLMYFGSGWLR